MKNKELENIYKLTENVVVELRNLDGKYDMRAWQSAFYVLQAALTPDVAVQLVSRIRELERQLEVAKEDHTVLKQFHENRG